ncbi:MAG: V-type ATPase subunit, partial [Acidimicrobiia bacterium]|nr:V-type ATPase subunit [Acidimicrobiia bacterium]
EAAIPRASGLRRLDAALRGSLAGTLAAMDSFYEGSPAAHVSLLVDRWVLHDMRTLIRLPDPPNVADVSVLLVPAGRLDGPALAELSRLPDVRSRVELAVAWNLPSPATARMVVPALATFERTGNRSILERAYAEAFGARLGEVLGSEPTRSARVLRTEIDLKNLLSALRLSEARRAGEPSPSDEYSPFTPGGMRDMDTWESLRSEDDPERVAAEAGSGWGFSGWQDALTAWLRHGELTRLADDLRRCLTAAALAGFVRGDPLGFDVPVAFMFAKEAEIRDLRLIGRAITHGIEEAEVMNRMETAA